MRKDILEQIRNQKELQEFIRIHPHWYRRLARNPGELAVAEIAALQYFERTIPQQVQKFSNGVQMASLMMNMLSNMKSSS